MKKLFLASLIVIVNCLQMHGQDICQDHVSYHAYNLGDGNSFIDFDLIFHFSNDSLVVAPVAINGQGQNDFMSFKIVGKKCKWIDDYKEGSSEYDLFSGEQITGRTAKMFVILDKNNRQIILQYKGDKEQRIFHIKP